jgi:hypothetical protein
VRKLFGAGVLAGVVGLGAIQLVPYGRDHTKNNETEKAAETVVDGEMPPFRYTINHPEARLDGAERQALIRGLRQTLGDD